MKEFTVLIVDDEQPARKKLISFLKESHRDFKLEEAANGLEAVKIINESKPDLVFLDIQMPGMTGFEVIKNVGIENMPAVIFVTAFDQFALDAFDVNAADYLLKPYDKDRFLRSVDRALEKITAKKENKNQLLNLLKEINKEKKYSERFLVNLSSKYFFVSTAEINYISAEEKYVELHTAKGKFLLRNTMNNIENEIDPAKFARIHRSYIVNIEQVAEIQPWSHGDYVVTLKNGQKLNMSRRYSERLLAK
jgi:two-component system LytT family response regulator